MIEEESKAIVNGTAPSTYSAPPHGWTCFHCGETFTTPGAARDHFGNDQLAEPGCRIKAGEERGLLMALRRAEAALATALRNAEQEGYDKGLAEGRAEIERLQALLNTPELRNFAAAVVLEAAHQRERWGAEHDAGKTHPDWFWLLGYLAGKALQASISGDADKALHHCISSAAALANWHAAIAGTDRRMRPGIDPGDRGIEESGA